MSGTNGLHRLSIDNADASALPKTLLQARNALHDNFVDGLVLRTSVIGLRT
jgi:hypothetical protein